MRVDELAASGHLRHQDDDLAAVRSLGIGLWRYGMPWRLTEPEPGRYDWTLWDRAFEACDRHGLVPVVDLCHFGLPDHYPGFCDPAWVAGFARYVDAFATRYPDPVFFTPVNEPMITAMSSGRLGAWNDRRSSGTDLHDRPRPRDAGQPGGARPPPLRPAGVVDRRGGLRLPPRRHRRRRTGGGPGSGARTAGVGPAPRRGPPGRGGRRGRPGRPRRPGPHRCPGRSLGAGGGRPRLLPGQRHRPRHPDRPAHHRRADRGVRA